MDEGNYHRAVIALQPTMCLQRIKTVSKKYPWRVAIVLGSIVALTFIAYAAVVHATHQRETFVLEKGGARVPITHIELQKDHMSPDALSIHVNEYVQFNTMDGQTHEIGLGGGDEYAHEHVHTDAEFESAPFGIGEAYRIKISKKGVYDFHDHKNPKLFATVIVY